MRRRFQRKAARANQGARLSLTGLIMFIGNVLFRSSRILVTEMISILRETLL
jgi:hypothetical protein